MVRVAPCFDLEIVGVSDLVFGLLGFAWGRLLVIWILRAGLVVSVAFGLI